MVLQPFDEILRLATEHVRAYGNIELLLLQLVSRQLAYWESFRELVKKVYSRFDQWLGVSFQSNSGPHLLSFGRCRTFYLYGAVINIGPFYANFLRHCGMDKIFVIIEIALNSSTQKTLAIMQLVCVVKLTFYISRD